jgi:hypothetical protein
MRPIFYCNASHARLHRPSPISFIRIANAMILEQVLRLLLGSTGFFHIYGICEKLTP